MITISQTHTRKALFLLLGLGFVLSVQAGRPLTVDDANVNDVGEGHVEGWWTRAPNGLRSWTVAPAYAPIQNVELSAGLAREQKTGLETQNIQAKFRLTPSQDNGCNVGAVVGAARTTGEASKGYVNALFTCNHAKLGSLHTNLGLVDVSSSQRIGTWGLAWERAYGDITAHVNSIKMNELPKKKISKIISQK